MPELPDITIYLEALERRVLGQPLARVRISSPFLLRTAVPPIQKIEGRRVVALRRMGKRIVFGFEDELWLVLHLMIAGRLHWHGPGASSPGKTALAVFDFPSGVLTLTEAGTKKRASLHLIQGEVAVRAYDPGGLDVLGCTLEEFRAALTLRNHTLKRALTDPRLFSGIGNAYSDELLHRARLSPVALTQKLPAEAIERLFHATQQTLMHWIEIFRRETGDSFPENVTAFRPEMAVHGKFGRACPVCGAKVQRIRYADNETNYCPGCQTGGKLLADRSLSLLLRKDWPKTRKSLRNSGPLDLADDSWLKPFCLPYGFATNVGMQHRDQAATPTLACNRVHVQHLPGWLRALLLMFISAQGVFAAYPDRFVWVFGWGLGKDSDVAEIAQVLDTAGKAGLNGAVVSFGLDTLCKHDADYFRRLEAVQQACERNKLELIPSVFSVGYGGGILSHNPNLAEGLPVVDAPFVVAGNEARFVADTTARIGNGGFEEFSGNKFPGFGFHDEPGKISFADTNTMHSGRASLRLENFASDPNGHGRVMQSVRVTPQRCYRVSVWVKTEGLRPTSAFRCIALVGDRELAPRQFNLPATTDWQKINFLFNSLNFDKVNLYAGLWEGKAGKVWLDDWTIEDAGPVNVLHRPGTPVTARSEDGTTTFAEGKDYAPLDSAGFNVWRGDSTPVVLKLLPGSRIKDGERLRVSWYHSMLIHDSQVTACMAEPELYEIFDHEAKLLAERLHPRRVLLGTDEVRMGGTCRACTGRDMAELLGECVTKQAAAIRRYSPNAQVYVWSDMFDPNHNAHGDYYLVQGDFTGSWKHVPRDLIMMVWGGEPRERSLRFFADQGFSTLVACYYDANNLDDVKKWIAVAKPFPSVRGFMYTPWTRRYDLLPAFGTLLR